MTVREIITELVTKECEAYQLVSFGLLPSVEKGVERLLPFFKVADPATFKDFACFCSWRKEVLDLFYKQIDYAGFLKKEKNGVSFRRFLFYLRKRIIGSIRERSDEDTIDKELAVPPGTLAYKLSAMLEEEQFEKEQLYYSSVVMAAEVEDICRQSCRNYFPVSLDLLFVRLKKEDAEYWNELYLTVKKITRQVISGQFVPTLYKEEILHDTWGDTALLLHDKVLEGSVPEFETSLHFRNYIARICQNKYREAFRKNQFSDVPLILSGEEENLILQFADEEICQIDLQQNGLNDIDCENEEEMNRGLAFILYDKIEPWYTELTGGIEDKAELIFLHYVEGLSYESIAARKKNNLPDGERSRLAGKLRQDVVRTRRILKQRFAGILKKNQIG